MGPPRKQEEHMQQLSALLASLILTVLTGARQTPLWQADVQIRSLTVTEEKGQLTARGIVVVAAGDALDVRVDLLLPVGVGIVSLGKECRAGPSPTGISELRARVECKLGNLSAKAERTVLVVTTAPPPGVARGFGVMAISDTPDPRPGNNFAERVIPSAR